MLILMGAYREGHIIGTQIALAAAIATAPDFKRMCCVIRNRMAMSSLQRIRRIIFVADAQTLTAGVRCVRATQTKLRVDGVCSNDVVSIALGASGAGMVRTERTDRDNVAALHSLGAAWPLVHARRQRAC